MPPGDDPKLSSFPYGEREREIWIAAQHVLRAYTTPITEENSPKSIKSRLDDLIALTRKYNTRKDAIPDFQYSLKRLLICLVAPLSPTFAEECWARVHLGDRYFASAFLANDGQSSLQARSIKSPHLNDMFWQPLLTQPFPVVDSGLIGKTR